MRLVVPLALWLVLGLLPVLSPLPAHAQTDAQTDAQPDAQAGTAAAVIAAMRLPEMIEVLRDEGIAYGRTLEDDLFPGRGGEDWLRAVDLVYDAETMMRRFEAGLVAALGEDAATAAAATAFFGDARGQQLMTLEIEARRALLDPTVEEAARVRAAEMAADADPRMAALRDFAEANDLIEANVQGALNANLAFFRGMADVGAFGAAMTEDEMLSTVWGQEAEVRAETEAWLFPYLALAYGPLADADLQAYTDFSRSEAGRRLNAALFAAFDAVFAPISYDLGRAAGQQLLGQDI